MSIVFLDMEGTPVGELSAIQMNCLTREIVDVYHKHAKMDRADWWARHHIHGLDPYFLQTCGVASEDELLKEFKQWLHGKDILAFYANDPQKEDKALGLVIYDMGLPIWKERVKSWPYQMARKFKDESIPVFNKSCDKTAHSAFRGYPFCRTDTELAKFNHGYHCALYDAYELYLTYLCN